MAVNQTRRAPRVPPGPKTLAAVHAAYEIPSVDAVKAAAKALSAWELDGSTPFGSDASHCVLLNAAGLVTLLEQTFSDADTTPDGMVSEARAVFTSRAFAAVGDLINLSLFLREGGQ